MSTKIFNSARTKSFSLVTDAGGATYVLKPNGKKHYYFTTAITANVTLDDAVATAPASGDTAETSHATGAGQEFRSDGSKWQVYTVSALTPGTHRAALTENSGAIGGTNDGNLPDLTATAATLTDSSGGTANTTVQAIGGSFSQTEIANNFADLTAMVNKLTADNVALRAAARENAAKINAIISSLEGNAVLASS